MRVLFTKKWNSSSVKKEPGQPPAESDQLNQSAEQMLRHSPEFQGRLDLKTDFQSEKEFL